MTTRSPRPRAPAAPPYSAGAASLGSRTRHRGGAGHGRLRAFANARRGGHDERGQYIERCPCREWREPRERIAGGQRDTGGGGVGRHVHAVSGGDTGRLRPSNDLFVHRCADRGRGVANLVCVLPRCVGRRRERAARRRLHTAGVDRMRHWSPARPLDEGKHRPHGHELSRRRHGGLRVGPRSGPVPVSRAAGRVERRDRAAWFPRSNAQGHLAARPPAPPSATATLTGMTPPDGRADERESAVAHRVDGDVVAARVDDEEPTAVLAERDGTL